MLILVIIIWCDDGLIICIVLLVWGFGVVWNFVLLFVFFKVICLFFMLVNLNFFIFILFRFILYFFFILELLFVFDLLLELLEVILFFWIFGLKVGFWNFFVCFYIFKFINFKLFMLLLVCMEIFFLFDFWFVFGR